MGAIVLKKNLIQIPNPGSDDLFPFFFSFSLCSRGSGHFLSINVYNTHVILVIKKKMQTNNILPKFCSKSSRKCRSDFKLKKEIQRRQYASYLREAAKSSFFIGPTS